MKKITSYHLVGHVAMFIANLIWGVMSPVSKYVMSFDTVSSFAVTGFRIFGGCLLFWLASIFIKTENVDPRDKIKLFFASLLAIIFNQGLFVTGVSLTSPINASVITTFLPIVTMVLAFFILQEPSTFKKVAGIMLGLGGALMLVFTSRNVESGGNVVGDLCCFGAQISFALYVVVFKDLVGKYSPVTIMKWMFLFATIVFGVVGIMHIKSICWQQLTISAELGLGYIVFLGTFLAYFFIPIGQHRLRPTVVTMYNYVQPVMASVVAVWVGMESFSFFKIVSAMMIFAGVFVVTQSKSKKDIQENNK